MARESEGANGRRFRQEVEAFLRAIADWLEEHGFDKEAAEQRLAAAQRRSPAESRPRKTGYCEFCPNDGGPCIVCDWW
jgi:hypothetical protein